VTGGANGLVGFASELPRGTMLLATVWAILIPSLLAYAAVFRGATGEKARLLRDAPLVAASLGIDAPLWRSIAFVVGGAYAGLAGGFSAALTGVVSPEATGFSVMLLCLTSVVVGGARHPLGAVLGAAVAVLVPELFRGLQGSWLLAYAAVTLAMVLWMPDGLAGLLGRTPAPPLPALPPYIAAVPGAERLVLDRVSKRFGGVEALAGVSFALARGEIVGLIGPQRIGQDDLLNTITGWNAPIPARSRWTQCISSGCPPTRSRAWASAAPFRRRSTARRGWTASPARSRPARPSCCSTSRRPA
jgi:branched-chain amino acid transport system permease protein